MILYHLLHLLKIITLILYIKIKQSLTMSLTKLIKILHSSACHKHPDGRLQCHHNSGKLLCQQGKTSSKTIQWSVSTKVCSSNFRLRACEHIVLSQNTSARESHEIQIWNGNNDLTSEI